MGNEAKKNTEELENGDKPRLQLIQNLPSRVIDGRDELNFAEFPLSAISERVDPSLKTLVFEDKIFDKSKQEHITRKVTITSSDAYGLPTPIDEEVLLALIQLSKLQNFQSKRVYFTRYQLLQLLKWPLTGQSYARLEQALNRWMGVTMYYKNAWRDRSESKWLDESFHMLECVRIAEAGKKGRGVLEAEAVGASYFEWNDVVYKSFCKGNVKALNYEFFLSLESSVAKRLYRFLDKRFYHSKEIEFDLKILAYEHIGLSRKSPTGDLKRIINSAIDELEGKGYLDKTPKDNRYVKLAPGIWKIIFRKHLGPEVLTKGQEQGSEPLTLFDRLIEFGVTEARAKDLFEKFPEVAIEEKLKVAQWMKEKGDSRMSVNAPGFLIKSIEQSYSEPKEYVAENKAREVKTKQLALERSKEKKVAERKAQDEAKENAKRQAVDGYLGSLDKSAREELEVVALSNAESAKMKLVAMGGKIGEAAKQGIVDAYVLEILANG